LLDEEKRPLAGGDDDRARTLTPGIGHDLARGRAVHEQAVEAMAVPARRRHALADPAFGRGGAPAEAKTEHPQHAGGKPALH
jgi:hypothetical protein